MKSLLTHEITAALSAGAGSGSVSPTKPGYLEKIILLVPTGLTVNVTIDIVPDVSLFGVENVYTKTSLTAGTYHLYPRAPTIKADATTLTSLPYVRPVFYHDDAFRLTLASGVVDGQPDSTKSVTAIFRYEPADPA